MQCAGVPVIPVVTALNRSEAIKAAENAGYPVALKTAAPGVLHKTDINPLLAGPAGTFAVDVRIRLAPAAPEPDWYARRMRGD
ncbi:acetate--CoA ligase family protein [Kribbella sp. NPDC048928]|uniref:acetate--CoA ligase family protein n=1 Tax=Kribbella sp. NPDC048928 TaxID=3364111 RepID=UPI00371DE5EE